MIIPLNGDPMQVQTKIDKKHLLNGNYSFNSLLYNSEEEFSESPVVNRQWQMLKYKIVNAQIAEMQKCSEIIIFSS